MSSVTLKQFNEWLSQFPDDAAVAVASHQDAGFLQVGNKGSFDELDGFNPPIGTGVEYISPQHKLSKAALAVEMGDHDRTKSELANAKLELHVAKKALAMACDDMSQDGNATSPAFWVNIAAESIQ